MKRGKQIHLDGIALPDGTQLRALGEEESYKYLGVLEADHVLHEELKQRVKKEYIRRVKKCLNSKLNMVKAINTWDVVHTENVTHLSSKKGVNCHMFTM